MNTNNRNQFDPGPVIFQMLLAEGYEGFDVAHDQDKIVWKQRQKDLGLPDSECDGVPGAKTRSLLDKTHKHGIWVSLPTD